jgi:carbon-monoxide dehydrogenase medium subunit
MAAANLRYRLSLATIRYEAPQSIEQAVHLMASDPRAKVLAGGTDLLIQFRAGLAEPTAFIDIKRIPGLIGIDIDDARLRLGAATPAAEICESAEMNRLWPGLVEAVHLIGSSQIQGRGTVGGNPSATRRRRPTASAR